jgi:hypothetical protein
MLPLNGRNELRSFKLPNGGQNQFSLRLDGQNELGTFQLPNGN